MDEFQSMAHEVYQADLVRVLRCLPDYQTSSHGLFDCLHLFNLPGKGQVVLVVLVHPETESLHLFVNDGSEYLPGYRLRGHHRLVAIRMGVNLLLEPRFSEETKDNLAETLSELLEDVPQGQIYPPLGILRP